MRAVCFDRHVVVRTLPDPEPGPGQALVQMTLAGVCGTDLEVTRGYRDYRGVLGHEFVGRVQSCPDAPQWEGRRVTADINLPCGECELCLGGLSKHCERRAVVGIEGHSGCFCERLVVPIANLHAVDDRICDERAVFTEPLAAAFEIFESVPLRPDTRVAVIGDGRLGLLIVMALRSREIPVTAVGRHPKKLDLVRGPGVQTSAPDTLDGTFDVVIDATGRATGLALALAHTRPRGTVVLKTTVAQPVTVDTTAVVVNELRLVGSRCGPFDVALAALANGSVDPRPLIAARYPLRDGPAALAHAGRPGVLKVLLASA